MKDLFYSLLLGAALTLGFNFLSQVSPRNTEPGPSRPPVQAPVPSETAGDSGY